MLMNMPQSVPIADCISLPTVYVELIGVVSRVEIRIEDFGAAKQKFN